LCDFFSLRNIKIAYLIIEGDQEENLKLDIFLNHESNNILFFKDKIVSFTSKINSRFIDMNNFMALGKKENFERGKYF
jgi:hypothetical protein